MVLWSWKRHVPGSSVVVQDKFVKFRVFVLTCKITQPQGQASFKQECKITGGTRTSTENLHRVDAKVYGGEGGFTEIGPLIHYRATQSLSVLLFRTPHNQGMNTRV